METNKNVLSIHNEFIRLIDQKEYFLAEALLLDGLDLVTTNPQLLVDLSLVFKLLGYHFEASFIMNKVKGYGVNILGLEEFEKALNYNQVIFKSHLFHILGITLPTISACLIVKNEELFIENCILRISPVVDEIIVVDTGSSDNTLHILTELQKSNHRIKLYSIEWRDDFSSAKNFSLSKATSDWIISIDADEYLFQSDYELLKGSVAMMDFKYKLDGRIPLISVGYIEKELDKEERTIKYYAPRLFPNTSDLRFVYRIHEQIKYIQPELTAIKCDKYDVPIKFEHYGYVKKVQNNKMKSKRNFDLILKQLKDDPDNPVFIYHYADELYKSGYYNIEYLCLKGILLFKKEDNTFGIEVLSNLLNDAKNKLQEIKNTFNSPAELHELFIKKSQQGDFKAAENILVNSIHYFKLNAQLWLDLAEILRVQNFGISCKRVLNRALLLDPLVSWENEFNNKLKYTAPGEDSAVINELLNINYPTVSAALIVKNEENNIETCIDSILNAVDEIVVVDTGSTDNTINLLKKYDKVRLYHFDWCDDFSAARNFSLSKVTSDWVFCIDADEYLHPEDINAVKEAAGIFGNVDFCPLLCVTHLHLCSGETIINNNVIRMFKTNMNLTFNGKIHEQIIYASISPSNIPLEIHPVRIRLFHKGYDFNGVTEYEKSNRNIKILETVLKENPEDKYSLFKYGGELFFIGEFEKAISMLEKCIDNNHSKYILDAMVLLIRSYMAIKDYIEAEKKCLSFIEYYPYYMEFHSLLSLINEKTKEVL